MKDQQKIRRSKTEDIKTKSYDLRVGNDELEKKTGCVAQGERQAKLQRGREEIYYVQHPWSLAHTQVREAV